METTRWMTAVAACLMLASCEGGDAEPPGQGGGAGAAGTSNTGGTDQTGGTGGTAETGGTAGETGGGGSGGGAAGARLRINEVYAAGDPADGEHPTDWVEIVNLDDSPVVLDGWAIGQDYDVAYPVADDLIFLQGTLEPGAFFVATTSNDGVPAMGTFGISSKKPERITLFDGSQSVVDDTMTDGADTDPYVAGTSWARHPDGDGAFARRAATKGAPNTP